MTLAEIKKSTVKEERDWEVLFEKLKSWFGFPEISIPLSILPSGENFNGCYLMAWIEAALGIPECLRGKGLVVLQKRIEKEYHDKISSIIDIRTIGLKEKILDNMDKKEIYKNRKILEQYFCYSTTTPDYLIKLDELTKSNIFPFRFSL